MRKNKKGKKYTIFTYFANGDIDPIGLLCILLAGLLWVMANKMEMRPIVSYILIAIGICIILYDFLECEDKNNHPEAHAKWKEEQVKMRREKEKEARERLEEQLQNEYEYAVYSQNNGAPWDKKYMTDPCPYCGHYKVRYSKWEDKQISVAFWGGASDKIGKIYKCENCNRMW